MDAGPGGRETNVGVVASVVQLVSLDPEVVAHDLKAPLRDRRLGLLQDATVEDDGVESEGARGVGRR